MRVVHDMMLSEQRVSGVMSGCTSEYFRHVIVTSHARDRRFFDPLFTSSLGCSLFTRHNIDVYGCLDSSAHSFPSAKSYVGTDVSGDRGCPVPAPRTAALPSTALPQRAARFLFPKPAAGRDIPFCNIKSVWSPKPNTLKPEQPTSMNCGPIILNPFPSSSLRIP